MKIYITKVCRKLKNLREEKKLTQEKMAELLGISRQSIISVERGKSLPSLSLALKLGEIFDATLEELFLNRKEGEKTMDHDLMPWSPLREMDHFFDEEPFSRSTFRGLHFPAVNVRQTEKNVIITADIPGVKEKDLQIEVGENFLNIGGERREEKEENEEGYFRREVNYGSFQRSIPLPTKIKPDKAEATLEDGQLKIVLEKIKLTKPEVTKVKIKKV